MNKSGGLKLPNLLNLGTILPGQYGESVLTLNFPDAAFLSLNLTPKAIANGFFLLKEGSTDCLESFNVVLKPNKTMQILIGSYPNEVPQSASFAGELIVSENTNTHKIRLVYQVEVPRISCKKMLEHAQSGTKMIKLIINKAVTSDVRIALTNMEDYSLNVEAGLLNKSSIADKDNPFILTPHKGNIAVEAHQQFFVFLNLKTNIGFKHDFRGLKRVVFRNVLTLKTHSVLIWCLPIEIIVIFVKQPEFKEE